MFSSVPHYFIGLFGSLESNFLSSLYIHAGNDVGYKGKSPPVLVGGETCVATLEINLAVSQKIGKRKLRCIGL